MPVAKLTAAALLLIAVPGSAANFTLDLTADPTTGSYSHFTVGATRYDNYYLALSGLDATNAFTVAQGDTLTENITFAPALTVPASQTFTFFSLGLTGSTFPVEDTAVTGTTTFYDNGVIDRLGATTATTSTQLVNATVEGIPFNYAWTFDTLTSAWHIDTLATPATLDRAYVSYQLSSAAVPEPATWALLVAGFGVVGLQARRRRTMVAAAA